MNSIEKKAAELWNINFEEKLKEKGYSQASFAKAFEQAYPDESCTQGKVSRWMNVGGQSSQAKEIGYPKYENMKKIADLLGVSVGYLIGETDYESFDMERACTYLGISKSTGTAIRSLTFGTGRWSDRIMGEEYAEIMSYLFTTPSFKEFIHELQPVFNAKWAQQQLKQEESDTMDNTIIQRFGPEVLKTALECMEKSFGETPEKEPEPTDELMSAIAILREAEDRAFAKIDRLNKLERDVQAAKYTLFEKYSKMISETLCDENVVAWNEHCQKESLTQKELMNLLNISIH